MEDPFKSCNQQTFLLLGILQNSDDSTQNDKSTFFMHNNHNQNLRHYILKRVHKFDLQYKLSINTMLQSYSIRKDQQYLPPLFFCEHFVFL